MLNFRTLLDDAEFARQVPRTVQKYKAGEVILEEDDEGRDVFFILSGKVQVSTHVEQHIGQVDQFTPGLATLGENDVFGELSMIDGEPRSARVVAVADSEVAKFDGPKMLAFMDANPDKGYFILRDIFLRLIEHMRKNTIFTKTVLQLYLVEHK